MEDRMENMLREYSNISELVRELNTELNEILKDRTQTYHNLKATKISDVPHCTDVSDPTYISVQAIIDKYGNRIKSIRDRINELIDNKIMLETCLQSLDVDQYRIIDMRYFKNYTWNRIPRSMHYSRRQCFRIKDQALTRLKYEYNKLNPVGAMKVI